MKIEILDERLTICKLRRFVDVPDTTGLLFLGKSEGELSLICGTACVPRETLSRSDGWRALRFAGELDHKATGILAKITEAFSAAEIGILAASTYNTSYIFVPEKRLDDAAEALRSAGYEV